MAQMNTTILGTYQKAKACRKGGNMNDIENEKFKTWGRFNAEHANKRPNMGMHGDNRSPLFVHEGSKILYFRHALGMYQLTH